MADLDLNRPAELLHGQLHDKQFRVAIPFTQQDWNSKQGGGSPNLGNASAEVTVVDANATQDKIYDYSALDASKLALFWQNPGFISFQLPEELVGLTAVFSTSKGVGAGNSVPHAESRGSAWSVGVSATNHAGSSLDFIPDLQPDIKTHDSSNASCIECYFFTSGNTTLADILTKLSTELGASVLAWPKFKAKRRSFTLKGQSLTLTSSANVQLAGSASGSSSSVSDNAGYDYSIETKTTVRPLDYPPYLNGSLTITGTGGTPWTASDTITVTAAASLTGSGQLVGTVVGGTTVPTQTVTGLISPHTLSATSPAAVPTTGLYLKDITPQASDGDLFLQLAIVVDFAQFA